MRKISGFAAILIALAAQVGAQDPGIQDSLIVGSAEADSSNQYQTANIPIYAVTDDSVTFACMPIAWHSTDDIFVIEDIWPDSCVYETVYRDQHYILILWSSWYDTCLIYSGGQRVQILSLRVLISPDAPRQLAVFDTCWDSRNGGLAFGLIDGLTQILPGFQRGFLSIGPVGAEEGAGPPERFSLSQNYPNPFNARTTIGYALAKEGPVNLNVYNLAGQRVATLYERTQSPGEHRMIWDAADMPSGIYLYRLESGDYSEIKRMSLIK
jgi:hypothetical protein